MALYGGMQVMKISKPKSQIEAIIQYLRKNKTITSLQAFKLFNATRLSGIIYVLKERGFEIETELVEVKNRYGHITRIAVYHLIKDIQEQEGEKC